MSPNSGSNGETSEAGQEPGLPETTPRWVYVFGIIFLVLVLVFLIVHLMGRGFGSHMS